MKISVPKARVLKLERRTDTCWPARENPIHSSSRQLPLSRSTSGKLREWLCAYNCRSVAFMRLWPVYTLSSEAFSAAAKAAEDEGLEHAILASLKEMARSLRSWLPAELAGKRNQSEAARLRRQRWQEASRSSSEVHLVAPMASSSCGTRAGASLEMVAVEVPKRQATHGPSASSSEDDDTV